MASRIRSLPGLPGNADGDAVAARARKSSITIVAGRPAEVKKVLNSYEVNVKTGRAVYQNEQIYEARWVECELYTFCRGAAAFELGATAFRKGRGERCHILDDK